jgi:glycolate oxidase FAD binding subunit
MIVAGVMPREVVEPPSIDAVAHCVRALYADDRSFAFAGGGTQLERGNAPRALDTLVRTTACTRVIDYAPQDQTITVESGMTLAAVGDVLARERQFLPIDVPDPERTTVGGAIATNAYGGRRLRYGGIRDIIVGAEMIRPDGTRARGGGKVVKNVAGFDMPKLMVGSLGTLGAIVSATFRVYPIAEAQGALIMSGASIETLMRFGTELTAQALVPAAMTAFWRDDGDGYDCSVSFEGFAQGVEQQMHAAAEIGARLGCQAQWLPAVPPAFAESERLARRHAAWRIALSAPPTALARFLVENGPTGQAVQRLVFYPLLGAGFLAAETLDVATVLRWRATLAGGSVVVDAMPQGARATLDAWGDPAPASLAIMRRLKMNFDPKGLCNAGRFVGGL